MCPSYVSCSVGEIPRPEPAVRWLTMRTSIVIDERHHLLNACDLLKSHAIDLLTKASNSGQTKECHRVRKFRVELILMQQVDLPKSRFLAQCPVVKKRRQRRTHCLPGRGVKPRAPCNFFAQVKRRCRYSWRSRDILASERSYAGS